MPILHIHLLGDFSLLLDDTPVMTFNSAKLQSLLAYLLIHRHAPQDRSHVAFLLWPDSTEMRAHASLRKLLFQLRQALPEIDSFLFIDNHNVQWRTGHTDACWTLDLLEVEQALVRAEQAAQAQDTTALRQALEQVVSLYRGDLLPSCYDEWILPERDRWHQIFLTSAERLLALLEQERDFAAAIPVAQRLLRQDPLHEETYRQLMRLYALRGDRAAALRVYHICASTLERELGAEPSAATRAAYDLLMQPDSTMQTPTGPLGTRGNAAPLLGRKVEWRQMQECWRKATDGGHPQVVILSGEAGIGKTRLAEEMEAWVNRQGMTTMSAHCYAAVGTLAYAPVAAWLRASAVQAGLASLSPVWLTEIARLLPDILATRPGLARPAPMTEGWQRQNFFEALARAVLAARQPLLLLLDDLQWCDSETLEWLYYLLRFDARLLLIGTVRDNETLPGHPLEVFLNAVQRDKLVTELSLEPLSEKETTALAGQLINLPVDAAMSDVHYSETEGNPLFIVEMVRAGTIDQYKNRQHQGQSSSLLTSSSLPLPPGVQSVLAARLAQLSPLAREVANVAAAVGREFTFSVLARVCSGSENSVVQGLDELWQRRIVREQSTGMDDGYDFSHDKLRVQAYDSLSPAYRRLLHRRIAEALKAIYERDQESISGQIALHYERAGLLDQAIPYYRQSGDFSRRIYANSEAIAAYERAIILLKALSTRHSLPGVTWETAVQIYESLGDVLAVVGRYGEARDAYHSAMSYLPDQAYLGQAHLQRKIANTWNHVSTNPHDVFHENATHAFQEAERILTQIADPLSADWREEWIDLQFAQIWPLRGSVDDMTLTIEKARLIIEEHGTQEQRRTLSFAEAMRDSMRNRYVVTKEAVEARREALVALQHSEDRDLVGIAHLALGVSLLWAGQLDEAEEQLNAALNLAENSGIAWLRTRCLTFLPFIFRKRGQVEQVRGLLVHAQDVGATRNNSILTGHHAWVAWRDGKLAEAEMFARKAQEERQPRQVEVDPFQWAGLWPLLGVALTQEQMETVIATIRMLLHPTQQPPAEQLEKQLQAVLQAWDAGLQEEARALLLEAVPLAKSMGYL